MNMGRPRLVKKMQRSIAIVIMNGYGPPCNIGSKLQNIINNLYLMDVKMAVLVDRTSQEIQQCIKELTELDAEEVLHIICVIEAPRVGDNEFRTKDGIIDINRDILTPLYMRPAFRDKTKLIVTNGTGSTIKLEATDSGGHNTPRQFGKNVAILTSDSEGFTEKCISTLLNGRGSVRYTFRGCPEATLTCTVSELILNFPEACKPERKTDFIVS